MVATETELLCAASETFIGQVDTSMTQMSDSVTVSFRCVSEKISVCVCVSAASQGPSGLSVRV